MERGGTLSTPLILFDRKLFLEPGHRPGRSLFQDMETNLNQDTVSEVLEGSSGEDEVQVEDETFGRIFPRTRRGKEFFPFPRPFRHSRTSDVNFP